MKKFLLTLILFSGSLIAETPNVEPPKRVDVEVIEEEPRGLYTDERGEIVHPVVQEGTSFLTALTNMVLVLAGLVALLYFAAFVMRRLRDSQMAGLNKTSDIVILERRALSPKGAIYLVDVKGKQFLIGESPNGLVNLSDTI